jgi:asparagine synthase (glutamine-hydrolysing)
MQAQSSAPVRTFSIGFKDVGVDEAPHAKQIAAYLGTCHTELYVTGQDALALIPRLPATFCEPFSDSSQVPTLLVSQLARDSVKVALTGDGGDELFAGYDRYHRVEFAWKWLRILPVGARRRLAQLLREMPLTGWNFFPSLAKNPKAAPGLGHKVRKIADILDVQSINDLNLSLLKLWSPSVLFSHDIAVDTIYNRPLPDASTDIESLMLADIACYLPDDLLVKVDRAAMAMSLECRAPFLDHRVIEYALGLTLGQKMPNREPKGLLKALLARYIPRPLFARPKQGFGIPIGAWLRGPLRAWSEDLLFSQPHNLEDIINFDDARQAWAEHLSGERNWEHKLWALLMFLAWNDSVR